MSLPARSVTAPSWPPASEPSEKGRGVSDRLRAFLAGLRRNVWLILAIIGLALTIAIAATLLTRPSYTAAASVQINDQSEEVLGEELDGDRNAASDWDVDRFLNTQLDILRSRALSQRVADALDLYDEPGFFEAMGLDAAPGHPESELRRNVVVDLVRSGLDVDLPRSSRIARIGFTSYDPEWSARLANGFARQFIEANLQRRYDSSAYARGFVAEQLEEARIDLEASERELNEYAREAGLLRARNAGFEEGSDPQADSVTSASLQQLNEAAIASRALRAERRARWLAVEAAPELASQEELANPTVQNLLTRRAELEAELQAARDRYLPDHPAIARFESDRSAVAAQLRGAARNVRASVRADFRAAAAANEDLEQQVRALRTETLTEQDLSVRYNTLARQADTARSIYDGLLQRYRELNASAGVAASNVSIIDEAEPPASPSAPNLARALLAALLGGTALAGAAVFVRQQFDDVVHVPEDVEPMLQLSLLGVIPRSPRRRPLAELGDPRSHLSEAYASLRGSLLYGSPGGVPKLIGVTSALDGEGKSTTSFALAVVLARLGLRVLLIDADLRRPSVHRMVGRENGQGLTDVLAGRLDADEALLDLPDMGFDILAAGPPPDLPSELIASPRMAQLLEASSRRYDATIIDGPPVLGLADAPMLAAIVDGTLFVIEPERAPASRVRTALERLRAVRPNLLGGVLVKFDNSKAANSYSAYSQRDYLDYGAARPARLGRKGEPEEREAGEPERV
jgi:capsular exopolysaccharide synthesis family protein